MADTKKFLDQAGVSVLWNAVAAELAKKAASDTVYTKTETDAAIAAAAYDDSGVKADIKANADAIAVLNGDSSKEGSVAYQIAQIVAGADADFDTLKEIADWIATHPDSVSALQSQITDNANAIADLEALVGSKSVATQIAEALENSDLSQYAKATDLAAAITRIATNETDIASLKTSVTDHGTRLSAVETKADSNATDITNLTGRIDGIVAGGGEPNLINTIKVNGVTQAITDKTVDIPVPVIEALTEAEIKAACGITA